MDPAIFAPCTPGKLVAIPGGEYAYLPNPLPPDWSFPVELWPSLSEAKQLLGLLQGIGQSLPNPGILLRPIVGREAIQSSRLEGTYASARELLLFELEPKESTSENDPINDHLEVHNYRRALDHGVESNLPLSSRLLREMHRILLLDVRGKDKRPGEFRKIQVAIGASKRFVPPPPQDVPDCMGQLEKYLHAPPSGFDPLVDCYLVHYQFETIHPFMDGNGRIGRLLLAIMVQQLCGLSKPWLYLSEFFEMHREEYIQKLFRISTHADWHGWVDFCIQGTIQQAKDTIERCKRLVEIREAFMQRLLNSGGNVRLNKIVESLFHSPFVRVADLPARLEITYPTAKRDIDRLVQVGILQELPNTPQSTYYAPEVFHIAYENLGDA